MRPVTKIAIGVIAAALCWFIAIPLLHAAPDAGAAAVVPDPDQDTLGFLKWSFLAIKSGKFTIVASALVMLLVYAARKLGGKLIPWFTTRSGGWALVTVSAALLELAHAWVAGASVVDGLLTGVIVLAGAVLGHTALNDATEAKATG